MPPFSSTTSISSNWSQKSIISSSIKGQGILQAKKPIPIFSGFFIPIQSKASIVSVAAFPTAIIPRVFFSGLKITLFILFCLIKFLVAGIRLYIRAASLSNAGSCQFT